METQDTMQPLIRMKVTKLTTKPQSADLLRVKLELAAESTMDKPNSEHRDLAKYGEVKAHLSFDIPDRKPGFSLFRVRDEVILAITLPRELGS